MRKLLRALPFVIIIVLIYLYQTKLVTESNVLPFSENWGRETQIGETTQNDRLQVSGDDTVGWIEGDNLRFYQLQADGLLELKSERPIPGGVEDFLSYGQYQFSEQKATWLGRGGKLQQATAEQNNWGKPLVLAEGLTHFYRYVDHGSGQEYVVTAKEEGVVVSRLAGNKLHTMAELPVTKVRRSAMQLNSDGVMEIALASYPAMGLIEIHYVRLDTVQNKVIKSTMTESKVIDYSQTVGEFVFTAEKDMRHLLYTIQSTRNNNKSVMVYDYKYGEDLGVPHILQVPSYFGKTPENVAFPQIDKQYADGLRMVVTSQVAKDPRHIAGQLVMVYMEDSKTQKVEQITNTRKFVFRPALLHKGNDTSIVYLEPLTYDKYRVLTVSDNATYRAKTNVITREDYNLGAKELPKYLGIAFIYLFIALLWGFTPLVVLGYIAWRHEGFYEQHGRKFYWLGLLLYVLTKAYFLHVDYYTPESLLYMPSWMANGGLVMEAVLQAAMFVVSWLATLVFRTTLSDEKSPTYEMLYFVAFDMTMSLLWYSLYSPTA